jgi:cytochrome b6-f complex iron-sulfur subunit
MSEHIVLEDGGQSGEQHDAGGESVTRRLFMGLAGVAGVAYAAAIAYPIYRYLDTPVEMALSAAAVTEVTLKDAQKLEKGAALMFKFDPKPGILIHHEDGTWTALSAVCTHLGCTVQYEPDLKRIHCNCHGGNYDPYTGLNVSGPPPKPLTRYKTTVNDTGVLVSRA